MKASVLPLFIQRGCGHPFMSPVLDGANSCLPVGLVKFEPCLCGKPEGTQIIVFLSDPRRGDEIRG